MTIVPSVVLTLQWAVRSLGGLVKTQIAGPHQFSQPGAGAPGFAFLTGSPGDANGAALRTTR